jgi:hypothetical protein
MWTTLLIVLLIGAAVIALLVLERLEFLSVFPRLRRRWRGGADEGGGGGPPDH